MMKYALILIPFMLAGCEAIGNYANTGGKYLPTIGERCAHWECMSEEGQAKSEAAKKREAAQPAPVLHAKPPGTAAPNPTK